MFRIYTDTNGNPFIKGNSGSDTLPTNLPMGTIATIINTSTGEISEKWFDEEGRTWIDIATT